MSINAGKFLKLKNEFLSCQDTAKNRCHGANFWKMI